MQGIGMALSSDTQSGLPVSLVEQFVATPVFAGSSNRSLRNTVDWLERNGLKSYPQGCTPIEGSSILQRFGQPPNPGSWDRERRVVARIEATELGLDTRYVVTSLGIGSAQWIYDSLYCARGQAENLIKLHKTQLASDRTSCRSALANQVRLVFHTAAYWLLLTVRDAIPKIRDLATAEFATLRLRLLKIAARIAETKSRVRLAFAAACPEADLFRGLAKTLLPRGP